MSSDGKSASPNLQGPVSISMDFIIFWLRPSFSQPLDFLLVYKLVDLIHKLPQIVRVLRKVSLSVDYVAIAVARYVPESALHVNNIREVVFAKCGYYFFQSFTVHSRCENESDEESAFPIGIIRNASPFTNLAEIRAVVRLSTSYNPISTVTRLHFTSLLVFCHEAAILEQGDEVFVNTSLY